MSASLVSSVQWWLTPLMLGTNNIAAGSFRARICASCPAPLGIEMNAPGACFCSRAAQRILKRLRHEHGAHRPKGLHRDRAGARRIGFGDEGEEQVLEALQLRGLKVAHLEHHLGASGNNAGLAGLEVDRACGPDAARSGDLRETVRNRRGQFDERDARVLALDHPRRARVIGLSDEDDPILTDADNAGDHAETQSRLVEGVALFDMRFEIADGIRGHDRLALALGKACVCQRLAQRRSIVVVARFVDLFIRDVANEGAASKKGAKVPFLIRPGGDVDRGAGRAWVFAKGARDFEPVHDAKRPIEPARMVLGFGVRAKQELGPGRARAAEHVANSVDRRFEACVRETPGEPAARLDVLRRKRRSMHAALVSAELGQAAEVGEQSGAVDLRHWRSLSLG